MFNSQRIKSKTWRSQDPLNFRLMIKLYHEKQKVIYCGFRKAENQASVSIKINKHSDYSTLNRVIINANYYTI